jgi:hypothetical protein
MVVEEEEAMVMALGEVLNRHNTLIVYFLHKRLMMSYSLMK